MKGFFFFFFLTYLFLGRVGVKYYKLLLINLLCGYIFSLV